MDSAGDVLLSTHQLYARMGGGNHEGRPPIYKVIGIVLAISSGLFIGVSFVIKKVGLLKANAKYNEEAGEGYGYLKNAWWWLGMTLMIIGEVCNFVAYAFVDAILVTPMGALSVVVTAILSAIFLKERLSFVGKVGCFNCIIGSVVIVINAPEQSAVDNIQDMKKLVIAPGFLSYAGAVIVGCTIVALWLGPKYGKKTMMVYISICSLIGGLSVVATQGLGAAIIAQIGGKSQFKEWFLYVLLVFVIATLLTEIIYLNVSSPRMRVDMVSNNLAESPKPLQRRPCNTYLLRFLHHLYYRHLSHSIPRIQGHTRDHLNYYYGLPSNLRRSSIIATLQICQGRA
jgi:drug/metabolite transporter (DMT)-like permease